MNLVDLLDSNVNQVEFKRFQTIIKCAWLYSFLLVAHIFAYYFYRDGR